MLISYKKPRGRFFIVGKGGSGPGPVPVPQPDDELWYTTSDGNPVDISGASFNANVVSHTYTGGKGVIKFDANLTEIGANSFENTDIVTVSFPDTLTTIGDSAFDSCPITELDLKNVQSLGMEAFDYNYVSALHIPASVNNINRNPFRTPYGNQTITVDENNTTFSDGGGCNCVYNETTHTLVVGGPNSTVPTGCTTIGEFAFSNCYDLVSIEFPASVTSIGWLAFGSDEQGNLATIRAHSVPTFESLAFMSVADNGTLYLDAGLDPTDWMNALPAGWTLVQPCNVSISAGANGLISVDGGDLTSSYTDTVNYGTQITIEGTGDTGYIFDQWSDGDSTNPRTLTVTSNVTLTASFQAAAPQQPNDEVWYTTSDSQTITPYNLKDGNNNNLSVVSNTYSDGKGVMKMSGDIVSTVNSFASLSNLTSISLPSSLTNIGNSCFTSCSNLASFDIPDSVTTIGSYAFQNCTSLASVTIPNSVTNIGLNAFNGCLSLANMNYTGNLEEWCNIIFGSDLSNPTYYTHSLVLNGQPVTNLVIPNTVTSINNYAFYGCSGLTSVTISNSVTRIGDSVFYNCSGLTSVTIPDYVTAIGDSAFRNCSGLTYLTIGSSVTTIRSHAFRNCTSLVTIESLATTAPTISNTTFRSVAQNGTLTVPSGADYSAWMGTGQYYLGYNNWTLVQQ